MNGYWHHDSDQYKDYFKIKKDTLETLLSVKDISGVIDFHCIDVIRWCATHFGAVSISSCHGHPGTVKDKGYIGWVFADQAAQMRFIAFLNELQVFMYQSDAPAWSYFRVHAEVGQHQTTPYDRMGFSTVVLRTGKFNNDRVRNTWWFNLRTNMIKLNDLNKEITNGKSGSN